MHTLGIDPGLTGALALIDDENNVELVDMPVVKQRTGSSVSPHAFADLIVGYVVSAGMKNLHAYVEQASARPGQGVSSTCKTCRGAGIIEGVLAALDVPYSWVSPRTWKRASGLIGADKDVSRARAMEWYPQASDRLARKKDHGRAEALLIAAYGRRTQ
jgi:hypothetical protein